MISRRAFLSKATTSVMGISSFAQSKASFAAMVRPDRLTVNQAVATVHPLASQSAMRILKAGGNAVDAAISAALVLGVVDGHNSGIGGGCLVLIRQSNGEILAIDGRETASRHATQNMYLRNGEPVPELSQSGPLACATPGQIAAMHQMSLKAGRLPWKSLFEDSIRIANNGHTASRSVGRSIAAEATELSKYPASKEIYFRSNGQPIREGDFLIQRDLSNTLQQIADQGPEWFYQGPFAKSCSEYLRSIGGILDIEDFSHYAALLREPLRSSYRGHQVIGFPTPSSGGMHIAQMLTMLERFPIDDWIKNRPEKYYHVLIEVMKRAFADRAYWLGDSDFVDVPKSLLTSDYLAERMSDFDPTVASKSIQHGIPPGQRSDQKSGQSSDESLQPQVHSDKKHTTHLTTADLDGNWVAMTCTINTSWGSKVTVPGTGVMLNNEMDDFAIAPGTPNAFGLIGAQANAVGPRKRPLSSMSPTIVLDAMNEPILTVGAAGGPKIINATLQVILRVLDGKQDIASAIAAPRIHQQWRPEKTWYENLAGGDASSAIPASLIEVLESYGHRFESSTGLAISQGIQRQGNRLSATHDPRAQGLSVAE